MVRLSHRLPLLPFASFLAPRVAPFPPSLLSFTSPTPLSFRSPFALLSLSFRSFPRSPLTPNPPHPHNASLPARFGDTKYFLCGGSAARIHALAAYANQELISAGLIERNHGLEPVPLGKTDRFSLFKVGPILMSSHGMGQPTLSICLHEITKLLYATIANYKKPCKDMEMLLKAAELQCKRAKEFLVRLRAKAEQARKQAIQLKQTAERKLEEAQKAATDKSAADKDGASVPAPIVLVVDEATGDAEANTTFDELPEQEDDEDDPVKEREPHPPAVAAAMAVHDDDHGHYEAALNWHSATKEADS